MRRHLAVVIVLAALSAASCSGGSTPTSPRHVPLPRMTAADTPRQRAGKLARYIEARWPRIRVEEADANGSGTVVAFNDLANFDYSIKDPGVYDRHVRHLTGDLAQASVELLKLSLRYFPNLRYATVWQDRELRAFWTKKEIEAMDRPTAYRSYRSFLKLVSTAQYPPSALALPPATG